VHKRTVGLTVYATQLDDIFHSFIRPTVYFARQKTEVFLATANT